MTRFCGKIGFAEQEEVAPDIWKEKMVEKKYYGDVIRNTRILQETSNLNPDVALSNQISVVANPYAIHNYHAMRYVVYMNSKWKIISVEVKHPRLILTVGGAYYND